MVLVCVELSHCLHRFKIDSYLLHQNIIVVKSIARENNTIIFIFVWDFFGPAQKTLFSHLFCLNVFQSDVRNFLASEFIRRVQTFSKCRNEIQCL